MRVGELGFWWRSVGGPPPPRAPLEGNAEADVAIVGGGYTGLWTAYYLKRTDPSLQVTLLESECVGFGASGRNGGWVSGFFSGPPRLYAARAAATAGYEALRREMFATVDVIARFLAEQGADADFHKGGHLTVALNEPQAHRVRREVREAHSHGLDERDLRELDGEALAQRLRVRGARSGSFSPHVARVHPVKLVLALAGAAQSLGVTIHECSPVREIGAHQVRTPAGSLRARWIVRATEGYTAALPGLRRLLTPVNSSMIVTEPLPRDIWREIGWEGLEVLGDAASVYCYAQRTADGRIAIGGRGVPYRFASRTGGAGDTPARTITALQRKLRAMFPAVAAVALDHAWSGVLGVARDWGVSVGADPGTGLAWAGGYVGEGVAAANLAGRMLCDLLLDRPSELVRLPWVGRVPARWEFEPLRWAEINGLYALYRRADARERHSTKPSRLAGALDRVSGRR
jgi:glycine/D-amino acid oxidase-like deaminating enzyme